MLMTEPFPQHDPDGCGTSNTAPGDFTCPASADLWTSPSLRDVPERIGGYRVLSVLGAGGMGRVYLAEQETPRRTVALKVIRQGPGTDGLLKRFQHEVGVLGILRHHGIAQIYDAGVDESTGRPLPYFAMELVKGLPIGEYAARSHLSTLDRLSLFARVCEAVQHAHHKGVIHRDLKPGNILVEDGGQPKILDFGVARATNHDLQAVTLHTDVGQLVGTLPYMSPEQVSGDPAELDTRSDVYSLGVVLFELLTGRLPLDVRQKAVTEAIRILSQEQVPRVSEYEPDASSDLDTIVAKSLEREKNRRYQSAGDLADDIHRYIRDEPILARPPSSIYLARKFAKRHKPLVAAATVALLGCAGGVGGVIWQGRVAARERDRTTAALDRANAVTQFLQAMLQSADPGAEQGRNARVADVLPAASQRVEIEMRDNPGVQGSLWETIGSTYYGLGMYAEAEAEFRHAHAAYTKHESKHSRDALRMLHNIAVTLRHQGELAASAALLGEAAELRATWLGEEDPDTLRSLENLATVLRRQGRLKESVALFRRVLSSQERHAELSGTDTLDTRNNLALALRDLGELDEALAILRHTLDRKRAVYGAIKPDHPEILTTRHNIGRVLADLERLDEADSELLPALAARERELGPNHAATLTTRLAVADVLRRRGDEASLAEATRILTQLLDSLRERGIDHDALGQSVRACLAACYNATSRFAEAEVEARKASEDAALMLGRENWITADLQRELANALVGLGRVTEADALLSPSLAVLEKQLGPAHWRTAAAADLLARSRSASSRAAPSEADP